MAMSTTRTPTAGWSVKCGPDQAQEKGGGGVSGYGSKKRYHDKNPIGSYWSKEK